MPRKIEYVVRVVFTHDPLEPVHQTAATFGTLIESLRYMGHIDVIDENETRTVVDFHCPDAHTLDTKIWSEQNAARMRSFALNAVVAPRT